MTLLDETLRGATADGFEQTRMWANMEWAAGRIPGGGGSWWSMKPRVNYLLPRYDDLVVCAYDLTKFGAGIIMDVLRTHPLVILGGILQENPFFVPHRTSCCGKGELRARDGSTPQS